MIHREGHHVSIFATLISRLLFIQNRLMSIVIFKWFISFQGGTLDTKHSKLALISIESITGQLKRSNNIKINQLKNLIIQESIWLSARDINNFPSLDSTIKDYKTLTNRWIRSKEIFAIPFVEEDRYPAYALNEGGQPLPVVKKILQIFDNTKTPWALAFWFGTANSWLGSQKPKDLLTVEPDMVINAATRDKEGAIHG